MITTTVPNAVLTLRNQSGALATLTLAPLAGGTHPVSATINILRLA